MTTVKGFINEITGGAHYFSGDNAMRFLDWTASGYESTEHRGRKAYAIHIPKKNGAGNHVLYVVRMSNTTAHTHRGRYGKKLYWKVTPTL